ncbi:hypothetical protein AAF712_003962 [Marasmius tenuissimus]|uniref:Uncharacterized protein n=1 Tax=Marasmius tenuissimus TaxID=585030 RepID=A0ABR3A6L1_9AGAR
MSLHEDLERLSIGALADATNSVQGATQPPIRLIVISDSEEETLERPKRNVDPKKLRSEVNRLTSKQVNISLTRKWTEAQKAAKEAAKQRDDVERERKDEARMKRAAEAECAILRKQILEAGERLRRAEAGRADQLVAQSLSGSQIDVLQAERVAIQAERGAIQNERNAIQIERNTIQSERHSMQTERQELSETIADLKKQRIVSGSL